MKLATETTFLAGSVKWMTLGCLMLVFTEALAGQPQPARQAHPSRRSSGKGGFSPPIGPSSKQSLLPGKKSANPFPGAGEMESIMSVSTPHPRTRFPSSLSLGERQEGERSRGEGFFENSDRGCGSSVSGMELDLNSEPHPARDETLRSLGLCGFTLWAWNPQTGEANKNKKGTYSPSATQGSPGHIFWVEPAFKADYMKNFKPLTPREKFNEWAQGAYDPFGFGVVAFESATLEHSSSDGFCGYGKGWGGYGKCFASMEADSNISSFFGDFLFPVILHQDPRYFRLGQGSFGVRVWYAVTRVFITHSDSGQWVLYSSALSGTVLAAAASNLYYPQSDRGFAHSVSRAGIDLGDTALFNLAAEFWPDIKQKLYHTF